MQGERSRYQVRTDLARCRLIAVLIEVDLEFLLVVLLLGLEWNARSTYVLVGGKREDITHCQGRWALLLFGILKESGGAVVSPVLGWGGNDGPGLGVATTFFVEV